MEHFQPLRFYSSTLEHYGAVWIFAKFNFLGQIKCDFPGNVTSRECDFLKNVTSRKRWLPGICDFSENMTSQGSEFLENMTSQEMLVPRKCDPGKCNFSGNVTFREIALLENVTFWEIALLENVTSRKI